MTNFLVKYFFMALLAVATPLQIIFFKVEVQMSLLLSFDGTQIFTSLDSGRCGL